MKITSEKQERTWGRWTKSNTFFKKPRVYVSIEEESILENFANRTSRPVKQYRDFVQAALADMGIEYTSLVWSKNAGCSGCPCSPGFILTLKDWDPNHYDRDFAYDIWVTVSGGPKQEINEEGAYRLNQLAATL